MILRLSSKSLSSLGSRRMISLIAKASTSSPLPKSIREFCVNQRPLFCLKRRYTGPPSNAVRNDIGSCAYIVSMILIYYRTIEES